MCGQQYVHIDLICYIFLLFLGFFVSFACLIVLFMLFPFFSTITFLYSPMQIKNDRNIRFTETCQHLRSHEETAHQKMHMSGAKY